MYKLTPTSAIYYQTVSYHTMLVIVGSNPAYIIITGYLNVTVLHWDSPSNQYLTIYSTSATSGTGNRDARGISPDGLYYIQDRYGSTTLMDLYMFGTGTYTMVSTFDLSTVGTMVVSEIKGVTIYIDSAGAYYAMIAYLSGGV